MLKRVIAALVLSLVLAGCGPSELEKERLAFEEKKYNDEQAARAEAAKREAEKLAFEQQKEAEKLAFEQQKYRDEQAAKAAAASKERTNWLMCRSEAEQEYNNEFKYWGEPVAGEAGVRNGPSAQMEEMKNRLQRKQEECDRDFPKGIDY